VDQVAQGRLGQGSGMSLDGCYADGPFAEPGTREPLLV
jgi:hypothetical protein